jgi:DNA repair exonuclease SbcCD nuclease subunit
MSGIQLMCAADLHLGRRPARVPVEVDDVTTADVWHRIVTAAIRRRVDAVLLAGDIIDADNQLYEAFGPLQSGVRRLADAEIWTVAVGGNHDHAVMRRIAGLVDSEYWRFLGEGGQWERCRLSVGEAATLDVVGWSFPTEHVTESPVASFPSELSSSQPTVGVMHGEFDAQRSKYAPVSRGGLESTGVSTWIFGHLHQSQSHALTGGQVLYPGSPQPLDPAETGRHGVTLVELTPDGQVDTAEPVDLAGLAYATTRVDVSEVDSKEMFEETLIYEIDRAHESIVADREALRWVVHRIELVGRCTQHRHLDPWSRELHDQLRPQYEGVAGTIDEVRVETRPSFDLEQLAEGDDPPGVLAELMLAAGAGVPDNNDIAISEELDALLRSLARDLRRDVYSRNAYAPLRSHEATSGKPTRDEILEMLRKTGWALLEEMMYQRQPPGAGQSQYGRDDDVSRSEES